MSAIEIRNITKRFGARTILKDVSFSVEDRELVVLIGPSGCGKSTLLNMIGTLEVVDKGNIRLYGRKLSCSRAHFTCTASNSCVPQPMILFILGISELPSQNIS